MFQKLGFPLIIFLTLIVSPKLYSQLSADFEYSFQNEVCAPATILFRNTSQGHTSCFWDFGDGIQTSTLMDTVLPIPYSSPGSYIVTLTVSDGANSSETQKTIRIYKGPTADFTVSATEACAPIEVRLIQDNSEGDAPIIDHTWNLYIGTKLYEDTIDYLYENPGEYDIYLSVLDSNYCTDEEIKENYIKTYAQPNASFAVDQQIHCAIPASVNFTNNTTSGLDVVYIWNFDDGSDPSSIDNPEHTYNDYGTYRASLYASNDKNCRDSAYKDIEVFEAFNASFTITDQSGHTIEDGDTACPGLYIIENSRDETSSMYWMIDGTYAGYIDSFPRVFEAEKWYTIELASSNECIAPITKSFYIDPVDASFEIPTEIRCSFPLTVNFTNTSVGATSYSWELAQGNTSTQENPVLIVDDIYEAGDYIDEWPVLSYRIALEVSNTAGCTDIYTQRIEFIHPEAGLYAYESQGCIPLDITLVDTSESLLDIISKEWIFDHEDNFSTLDTSHIEYSYADTGEYRPQLVLVNERNCRDTAELPFPILAGNTITPVFDFAPKTVCPKDNITFTYLEPDHIKYVDFWDYSSAANISSNCNTEHSPIAEVDAKKTGAFDMYLTVGFHGCISSDTLENALTVNGPIAFLRDTINCSSPMERQFYGSFDQVTSFSWNFGDGSPLNTSDQNPVHTYSSTGDYPVSLIAENSGTGCPSYVSPDTVYIRDVEAVLEYDADGCYNILPIFDAKNSIDVVTGNILYGYQWRIDSQRPHRTYSETWDNNNTLLDKGVYDIELICFDTNGCSDTATGVFEIFRPDAHFTMSQNSACADIITNVDFEFITSDPASIKSFDWDFLGNGHYDFDNISTYSYPYNWSIEESLYPTLRVFDTNDCELQDVKIFNINKPNAGFYIPPEDRRVCLNIDSLVECTRYYKPDISSWEYKDDNGFVQNIVGDTTFKVPAPGIYTVTHAVDKGGCVDTAVYENWIRAEYPSAEFTLENEEELCRGDVAVLAYSEKSTTLNTDLSFWDFDHGLEVPFGDLDTAHVPYSKPGTYHPSLTVFTLYNLCKDVHSIDVVVSGAYAEMADFNDNPCLNQNVLFEAVDTIDVSTIQWYFGDGSSNELNEFEVQHAYDRLGEFMITLRVDDDNPVCEPHVIEEILNIKTVEASFEFAEPDQTFCVNQDILPENTSVGAISYSWRRDGINFSSSRVPDPFSFDAPGTYTITLEISAGVNCEDTYTEDIIVNELPSVSVTATDSICQDDKTYLTVHTSELNLVQWLPQYLVDSINSFTTTANPDSTTLFSAIVTDTATSCVSLGEVTVYVHRYPDIWRNPVGDTTILLAQKAPLIIGSNYPSTFSWNTGKDTIIAGYSDTLTMIPLEDSRYSVIITDECFENEEEFNVFVREIYTVELPDVFTPNGDGVNDRIYVMGGGIKELIEFKIYNRFGNLVYYSDDITEGWDGYYNGKLQNPDLYNYFVRAITVYDDEIEGKGSFNLSY